MIYKMELEAGDYSSDLNRTILPIRDVSFNNVPIKASVLLPGPANLWTTAVEFKQVDHLGLRGSKRTILVVWRVNTVQDLKGLAHVARP
jgi:hypothetical protein